MKKLIATTTGSLSLLAATLPALAQVNIQPCPTGNNFGNVCTLNADSFPTVIQNIITILFVVAILVAIFFLIWGGIKWIISAGDKAKIEAARNTIIGGIIGLILVFLAFFIVQLVAGLFGITISNLSLPRIGS